MDPRIHGRNLASRDQLRAVGTRLSNEQLLRPIDPPWTAAALLAHMAFWDRFVHARWLHARQTGSSLPVSIDDTATELLNQAALFEWLVIAPRAAVEACLAAADALDALLESLEEETVTQVLREGRERLVDRSLHRGEHLETIERAFGTG
jgi:DinB superfamily